MSRLPTPGSDDGTWGAVLNDFLSVEHNADGTLKASGSLASKIPTSTVTAKGDLIAASAAGAVTRVGVAADNTSLLVPSSGQAAGVAWSASPTVSGQLTAQTLGVTGATGAAHPGRFAGVTVSGAPTSGTFAVGDYVVDQNGQMFVCVGAGTPGTWVYPRDGTNLLASGEETLSRDIAASFVSTNTGIMYLSFGVFRKSETTTQVRVTSGTTAAGATPTLCKIGLYAIAAGGSGTLVASTANDTSLFAVAQTTYTRSWSVPYAKAAGQRFALAILVVTPAAAPQICGAPIVRGTEPGFAPRLAGYLTGQTDLPASFTDASLTTTSSRMYGAILP